MTKFHMVSRGWWLILFILAACAPLAEAVPTEIAETDWLAVYFSDPNAPGAAELLGGPDEPLQAAIENARLTIDMAIYDLNLFNLRDALIEAAQRGVEVRLVIESENFEAGELQPLTDAGIAILGDEDPDLMHNKFTLIDHYEVWTGSFNYTLTDAYGNRNNLVRIKSAALAENYLMEFEEMFAGFFGSRSPAFTPHPQLAINGVLVETYFSPDDGVAAHLVRLVDGAYNSIFFLAYSFTSDELADALLAAQARGVEIHGVMDNTQAAHSASEYPRLLDAGIEVRLDGEGGSLHHKVLVIDETIVVTGSYNFSANAEQRNDENALVIHDANLASEFIEEFWRIWELAQP
ncbi:MAG: phospholipase D-like domain-containing protein [Anaerolineales bacterium]